MAANAPQTQFRDEFITGFEVHQSLLRDVVTTEAVIKGSTATFLVADSGSASAVTRGANGLIPARADSNTQTSATLAEWHDLVRKPGFNIFESQGNQRKIMQMTTMAVVNRKIDSDILTALGTATNDTGSSVTASLDLVMKAKTILGNAFVPWDSNICAIISPAFEAYLMQVTEYSSADYVNIKSLNVSDAAFADKPKMKEWAGVKWIVHPQVSGVGTATEVCFMLHKTAIGHGIDKERIKTAIGFDEEQDYSFARATVYMGSALLQNAGVVVMNHDGSAYVAS